MSIAPTRLVFNVETGGAATSGGQADTAYLPPAEPRVELLAQAVANKLPRQANRLAAMQLDPASPNLFGDSLDWAYRCYQVVEPGDGKLFRSHLYLFNVVVALEWSPSSVELSQLRVAFRRASDFLFDVTDGWMAFGQVIFGGPELMDCADIQIMASTRILPRSWVGAMHDHLQYPDDQKYTPIRLGRGLWSDNLRGVIGWEEPEAYRILIHEWCHYALMLTDEYLETRQLLVAGDQLAQIVTDALIVGPTVTVVTLNLPSTSDSIMTSTEGASELITDQWAKLQALYPQIVDRPPDTARPGPERLPADLPRYRVYQPRAAQAYNLPPWRSMYNALYRSGLPEATRLECCWLYLVKGLSDGPDALAPSGRIISQGSLEARSLTRPFEVKGGVEGDLLVLIGSPRDAKPVVLVARLTASGAISWQDRTPKVLPMINLVPVQIAANATSAPLRLGLRSLEPAGALPQAWLVPLGATEADVITPLTGSLAGGDLSDSRNLGTLDGHVLLRWPDGSLLINSFSQGGDGPGSGFPYPANPMNAGSGDGQALLFMHKQVDEDQPPNDIKVVTTLVHRLGDLPAGWRARSSTFAIGSNQPLPARFSPTLTLYYDAFGGELGAGGDLRICRLMPNGWVALPTYLPAGFRFALAPLDTRSGGTLLDPAAPAPRVEYYQVCWVPRS